MTSLIVPNPTPTLYTLPVITVLTILWQCVVKDKANHAVILDKGTSDKLYKDVQSYRLITVATLVDRLKINGSLARRALKDLEEKGQIKKVVGHSALSIYSTSTILKHATVVYENILGCINVEIELISLSSSGCHCNRVNFALQACCVAIFCNSQYYLLRTSES